MNLYMITVSTTDKKTGQTESKVFAIPATTPNKAILKSEQYGTFVSISENIQELSKDWS